MYTKSDKKGGETFFEEISFDTKIFFLMLIGYIPLIGLRESLSEVTLLVIAALFTISMIVLVVVIKVKRRWKWPGVKLRNVLLTVLVLLGEIFAIREYLMVTEGGEHLIFLCLIVSMYVWILIGFLNYFELYKNKDSIQSLRYAVYKMGITSR